MDDYIVYPKQLNRHVLPVERNHCFFLMPFHKSYDIIYGKIKQYLNDEGFICNRADEITGSTPIISKILVQIMKSQYIIVDLTECNPNVFYELGIAHTLKEARNVFLIKQKKYEVPFDIKHLTYVEYDPQNLNLISSQICNFLNNSKSKNEFYDALSQHGIINYIDERNNEFVESVIGKLSDNSMECLTQNLLIDGKKIPIEDLYPALLELQQYIKHSLFEKNYRLSSKLMDIYYYEIQSTTESDLIREQVRCLLNDFFTGFDINESIVLEYKSRLALLLANHEMYMEIVMPWILNYFSRSKTATIDLNRYNLERFLMTSTSSLVDNAIISRLCDKDCYIREHMADIIGEKKLTSAVSVLKTQLLKEENYFTAQSMMEAIGKISHGGIATIEEWVNIHKSDILSTKQLFVLKHAFIAISKLDDSDSHVHISNFQKEFGEVLKDYYII